MLDYDLIASRPSPPYQRRESRDLDRTMFRECRVEDRAKAGQGTPFLPIHCLRFAYVPTRYSGSGGPLRQRWCNEPRAPGVRDLGADTFPSCVRDAEAAARILLTSWTVAASTYST